MWKKRQDTAKRRLEWLTFPEFPADLDAVVVVVNEYAPPRPRIVSLVEALSSGMFPASAVSEPRPVGKMRGVVIGAGVWHSFLFTVHAVSLGGEA